MARDEPLLKARHTQRNKPVAKDMYSMFHLMRYLQQSKSEKESRIVFSRNCEEAGWGVVERYKVAVVQEETISGDNGEDSCTKI